MFNNSKLAKSVRLAIAFGAATATLFTSQTLQAQEETPVAVAEADVEVVSVTGTRIRAPGVESTSPIFSMDAAEIGYLQQPEFERVIRTLPSTIPADGGNVNNGTEGAATIDLRGLGAERNLVLMNGKRMVPFSFNGEVDTATIPTALIDRIDVVTGGASAVYGSDAIAGAVNIILKRNFQGVEFDINHSETGDSDGKTDNMSLTLGSDLEDGRGNAVLSVSWLSRDPVLLGQRPLGLLGIDTASGANYEEFLNGQPPAPAPSECSGPNIVASGGSTTAIPTRFAIVGGGAAASGQFRNDRTLLAETCSVFNFNPFNYYQTPLDRYSATALVYYDVTDDIEAYSTLNFTNTTVDSQVAPSGTFGETFDLPLANPFIGDQARQFMIDAGNTALANGLLTADPAAPLTNWQDTNGNGVVDAEDYLTVQLRRRTVELGARTESYDSDQFQINVGVRGAFYADWEFDASFQYGESNRVRVRDGYTNLGNIQNALDTVDGINCRNGDATCVPIDLFGGFGTITPQMSGYARAIALIQEKYEQTIGTLIFTGPVDFIELPTASAPLAMSIGFETREETGSQEPDECLKEAPSSCQGGAGGNLLPVKGGYNVDEFFFEGILPVFDGQPFAEKLDLEFGFRYSDYNITGSTNSWKFGFNWRPVDQLLLRVMQQEANRAPNVGELASPVVTGLDDATMDPCSVANVDENGNSLIDDRLRQLCISTGMNDAQVGQVQDIISGQVNTFDGSDPNALPGPEEAQTFTAGFVWTPEFSAIDDFSLSVDYYDIDITNIIGEFSPQEIFDACYINGDAEQCAKINRIGGDLTISGAGIELFTTNLAYLQAEGVEIGFNFGVNLGDMGDLKFSGNINKYLTQESQSADFTAVVDCKGVYGTSCDPLSDLRWIQRTTWIWNDFTLSAQWRHIDAVDVQPNEADAVFEAFRHIDSYDYVDLFASYTFTNNVKLTAGVDNLFDKDAPVLGNEVGDTSSNSGNTFPSNYDNLGRVYRVGLKFKF